MLSGLGTDFELGTLTYTEVTYLFKTVNFKHFRYNSVVLFPTKAIDQSIQHV